MCTFTWNILESLVSFTLYEDINLCSKDSMLIFCNSKVALSAYSVRCFKK